MTVPFNMKNIEEAQPVKASDFYPPSWNYDPISQTTDLEMMGGSSPTTRSSTDSTGVLTSDGDEANDDTGSD